MTTAKQPQPSGLHRLHGVVESDTEALSGSMPRSHEASITLTVPNLDANVNPGRVDTPGPGEPTRTPSLPPANVDQAPDNENQRGTTGYGR